jgi:3-oxoacyl-[acyl-carrier protein] reductase
MAQYPELKGRVALVTGAGQGIGAAIARALADQGCHVAVNDLTDESRVARLCSEIADAGGKALPYECDVRDGEAVRAMVDNTCNDLGGLHIVVNNVGVCRDEVVWKMSDAQWNDVIDTNLKGCFNVIRAAAPALRRQNNGRIVNISSINGLRGKFGQANYAASKAGVIALTKSVAQELARFHITVNAVAPGFIETDMTARLPEAARSASISEIPLGKPGKPNDVAAAVVFLCSDAAQHITGQVIRVDGGQYM